MELKFILIAFINVIYFFLRKVRNLSPNKIKYIIFLQYKLFSLIKFKKIILLLVKFILIDR